MEAVELNAHEARVLGVLVEKSFTTPEQYPLTLNATRTGSNQKSNRNPVVTFGEAEVLIAFQGLEMKELAHVQAPERGGGRVEKWTHTARERLNLRDKELAVLCELLLRGPQSTSELARRASRMRTIRSEAELDEVLQVLIGKGYAQELPAGTYGRVQRWKQLIAPGLHPDEEPEDVPRAPVPRAPAPAPAPAPVPRAPEPAGPSLADRVGDLEEGAQRLGDDLAALAEKLGEEL